MSADTRGRGPSRRDFLKGLGATGAGLVAAGAVLPGSPAEAATSAAIGAGRYTRAHGVPASSADFGRIFPKLPPFAEANDRVRAALLEVGKPGGIMDARDQLSAGAKALTVAPTTFPAACRCYSLPVSETRPRQTACGSAEKQIWEAIP